MPILLQAHMVRIARFELARSYEQQIFLLLHITMAAMRCSLDFIFTISYDLGARRQVSTRSY